MIEVLIIGKPSSERMQNIILASRAFGANAVIFTTTDKKSMNKMKRLCQSVSKEWGGTFNIQFISNWKTFIPKKKNYKSIYLTRYGIGITEKEYELRTYKNILLILSVSENIKELYNIADFNISITHQPHTIISAIVAFLSVYYHGRELALHFENAEYKIIPEVHGIHVEKK